MTGPTGYTGVGGCTGPTGPTGVQPFQQYLRASQTGTIIGTNQITQLNQWMTSGPSGPNQFVNQTQGTFDGTTFTLSASSSMQLWMINLNLQVEIELLTGITLAAYVQINSQASPYTILGSVNAYVGGATGTIPQTTGSFSSTLWLNGGSTMSFYAFLAIAGTTYYPAINPFIGGGVLMLQRLV
jgi:hypothetical protein